MLTTESQRRNAALHYLQKYHPILSMRIASSGALDGMGDFWSDLRDKTIGNVKASIKAKVDKVTGGLSTSVDQGNVQGQAQGVTSLSQLLGPSTATALYNIYRIQKGKAPVQVTDVVGASKESQALRFVPIAIGTFFVLWGGSKLLKAWRG